MPGKSWDGQNLAICGQNLAICGQNLAIFDQNWQFWEFLTYNFQTLLWNFLIFGMKVVLKLFFEKIILYMPRKFWDGQKLAICGQKLAIFDQNWH